MCCAGSRLLMQESIAEPLIAKIRDRMSTLRVGSPLDKAIDIGAIVARVQLDRIQRLVKQGVAEGATCWQPEIELPVARTLLSADAAEQCASDFDRGAAGNFWSGAGGDDVPHAERSGRTGEQHRVRTGGVRVERKHQRGAASGGAAQGGCGRGSTARICSTRRADLAAIARADSDARAAEKDCWSIWNRHGSRMRRRLPPAKAAPAEHPEERSRIPMRTPAIDRTVKLYIGGKQARPDSGYSMEVRGADGRLLGEAPLGIAKTFATRWRPRTRRPDGRRPQRTTVRRFLYYMAENLSQRRRRDCGRLAQAVGETQAAAEVSMSIERIFSYAAWTDKFDGAVHNPPFRNVDARDE